MKVVTLNNNRQIMEQEICVICLEPLDHLEKLVTLECKHIFHSECLYDYMYYSKLLQCPMCRSKNISYLRQITQKTLKQYYVEKSKMEKTRAQLKLEYIVKKWKFRTSGFFQRPSKQAIFEYIQNEDQMYESICELERAIYTIRHKVDKCKAVLHNYLEF